MRALITPIKQLWNDEDGTTATEYAIVLGLIVLVALTAITLLGQNVRDFFNNTSEDLPEGTA